MLHGHQEVCAHRPGSILGVTHGGDVAPCARRSCDDVHGAEYAVSTANRESAPETDGSWIVYQSEAIVPPSYWSVMLFDLSDGSNATIGGGDSVDQMNPDVSLGRVVYEDHASGNANVRVYDSETASYFWAANSADEEVNPRIAGNLVVWLNETDDQLWYRDIYQGITAQVPGADNITAFDVDNGRIVWGEAFITENLWVFDPSQDTTARMFYTVLTGEDIESLRVHGDTVAVTSDVAGTPHAIRIKIGTSTTWAYWQKANLPDVFHDTMVYSFEAGTQNDLKWIHHDVESKNIGWGFDDGPASVYERRIVYQQHTSALNEDIYLAFASPEVVRTQGTNRYSTAVAASKAYFSSSESVILCTGTNFPDALAAGPFAKAMNCPLLLTQPDSVPSQVMAELDRLDVSKIFIVGGDDVVKPAVWSQLVSAGYSPSPMRRIAGRDRYATSVEIALAMTEVYGGVYTVDKAFFARGDNFPDALAVGPVAAGALSPIILVNSTSVPSVVGDAVDDLNITTGVIVGGSDVVSNDVYNGLKSLMAANGADPNPIERWAGSDRYATAIKVVENGVESRWIDLDTVGVATGANFPDALGAGAALGYYGSPLVLVGGTVPASVSTWVVANKRAIGRMDVFGGSDVVPDSVKSSLASKLQ